MAWRLKLSASPSVDGFGPHEAVVECVSRMLPGVHWETLSPPGRYSQKTEGTSNDIWLGNIVDNGLMIMFRFLGIDAIISIEVEVKGHGNPLPLLHRLCASNDWSVFSVESGDQIDLEADSCTEWKELLDSKQIKHGLEYGKLRPAAGDIEEVMKEILLGNERRPEFTIEGAAEREGQPSLHIATVEMTDAIGWCLTMSDRANAAVMCHQQGDSVEFTDCVYCGVPTQISEQCIVSAKAVVNAASYFLETQQRLPQYKWISQKKAFRRLTDEP